MNKFGKILNEHSEGQYLKLEQQFFNLYNLLESLLTITEGEDLDSDSQKLIHFSALCSRVNEGVERFAEFTQGLQDTKFIGNSAPLPEGSEYDTVIYCTKSEKQLMIQALEHIANSFPDMRKAKDFQRIADDIRIIKNNVLTNEEKEEIDHKSKE